MSTTDVSGSVDYRAAWDLQREVHAEVADGRPEPCCCSSTHRCSPAASAPTPHERPLDPGGAEVIDVDRGGKITFHGPGQLVGYPIVRLPDHVLVVDYVRRVEEALIGVCAELGRADRPRARAQRRVWLQADPATRPERKIAAIGIRVSRGVTMHGFALNCDVDLGWYDRFVPCGIADAGVTSLSRRARPRRRPSRRCSRSSSGTSTSCSPGRRTTPTPDYDRARPEAGRPARTDRACVSRCSIRWPEPRLRPCWSPLHAGEGRVETDE